MSVVCLSPSEVPHLPVRQPKKKPPHCGGLYLCRLARPEGFEPPTPKFVAWCSIQLSYGRVIELHSMPNELLAVKHFLPRTQLAETEGFEPSIELLTLYSLSRGAPSASRARSRVCCLVSVTATSPRNRTQILAKNAQKQNPTCAGFMISLRDPLRIRFQQRLRARRPGSAGKSLRDERPHL